MVVYLNNRTPALPRNAMTEGVLEDIYKGDLAGRFKITHVVN
jgi:hypothetical protein